MRSFTSGVASTLLFLSGIGMPFSSWPLIGLGLGGAGVFSSSFLIGVIVALTIVTLVTFASGGSMLILYGFVVLLPALIWTGIIRRDLSVTTGGMIGIGLIFGALTLGVVSNCLLQGLSYLEWVNQITGKALPLMRHFSEAFSSKDPFELKKIVDFASREPAAFNRSIAFQIPPLVLIGLIFHYGLMLLFFRRRWPDLLGGRVKGLQNWKAPELCVWGIIFSLAGYLLLKGEGRVISTHLLQLFATLYFLQGVAIIAFWCQKKALGRGWRAIIYCVALFYAQIGVAVLGLVDLWCNFRRVAPENE